MFQGLSAFPLTPMDDSGIHRESLVELVKRLTNAKVDSIGILGSTGSYAYLTRAERAEATELAVDHADGIPVMSGIGALRTRDVIDLAEDAQKAGASAVMLAPVSYQKLTEEEVFGLYKDVTRTLSIPLCVYDNPATTDFIFTNELYARIAELPNVQSIKIPPLHTHLQTELKRVIDLKILLPPHISIGISGDWCGANGMIAGCDVWYSAIGGLFPELVQPIIMAVKDDKGDVALKLSERLEPLWNLFKQYGSLRVIATMAEMFGIVDSLCLPAPLKTLDTQARHKLTIFLESFLKSD